MFYNFLKITRWRPLCPSSTRAHVGSTRCSGSLTAHELSRAPRLSTLSLQNFVQGQVRSGLLRNNYGRNERSWAHVFTSVFISVKWTSEHPSSKDVKVQWSKQFKCPGSCLAHGGLQSLFPRGWISKVGNEVLVLRDRGLVWGGAWLSHWGVTPCGVRVFTGGSTWYLVGYED